MKVLFVSSGNSKNGISPIIKNQGESLLQNGVDVDFYQIRGKGIKGYLKNIKPLRNLIKNKHFDIIHAHYSLSAIITSFSGAKPLVVSLMGSDVKSSKWLKTIIWFFYKYFWNQTIVKSKDMKMSLGFKNVSILPNGVDLKAFREIDANTCRNEFQVWGHSPSASLSVSFCGVVSTGR